MKKDTKTLLGIIGIGVLLIGGAAVLNHASSGGTSGFDGKRGTSGNFLKPSHCSRPNPLVPSDEFVNAINPPLTWTWNNQECRWAGSNPWNNRA